MLKMQILIQWQSNRKDSYNERQKRLHTIPIQIRRGKDELGTKTETPI